MEMLLLQHSTGGGANCFAFVLMEVPYEERRILQLQAAACRTACASFMLVKRDHCTAVQHPSMTLTQFFSVFEGERLRQSPKS